MIATRYHQRRLGRLLKRGDAWITGRTSSGRRWPDPSHYWIVQDSTRNETFHVLVDERPRWGKYAKGMHYD